MVRCMYQTLLTLPPMHGIDIYSTCQIKALFLSLTVKQEHANW